MLMKNLRTPSGLDAAEVERILKDAAGENNIGARMDCISELFLGRPYVEGSLAGGPELPEEFRIALNAFDCVTYIEVVLGLALAQTIDEFIDIVRRVRYEDGEIDWVRRNHYMTDWGARNAESGFITNITTGPGAVEKTCTLSLIAGLPAKTTTFRYFPTQSSAEAGASIETGDLILFVSTRQTLDVFHTGIVVVREWRRLLRHATRTAGAVIEQELAEFVSENEIAGFILLKPLCRR